jgi:hypothetical protein
MAHINESKLLPPKAPSKVLETKVITSHALVIATTTNYQLN